MVIYSFHMPLFFVITGLIIGSRRGKGRIRKDFLTYLVPYFVWSIIYLILSVLANYENIRGVVLERLYAMVSFRGAAPLWFLCTLFWSKVLFTSIDYVVGKLKTRYYIIYFLILAILFLLCVFFDYCYKSISVLHSNPFIAYPFVAFCRLWISIFFVIFGYLVSKSGMLNKVAYTSSLSKMSLLLCSVLFLILINLSFMNKVNMHLYDFDSIVLFFITAFIGVFAILLLCMILPPNNKMLSYLGKHTLEVMVLHYHPIPLLTIVFLLFQLFDIAQYTFIQACVVLLVVLVIIHLLKVTVYKNPVLKFLLLGR